MADPSRKRIRLSANRKDLDKGKEKLGDEGSDDLVEEGLVRKSNDPKFWRVKCSRGQEEEAVIELMQKKKQSPQLPIISAFASPKVLEHIYVEATEKGDVERVCRTLKSVPHNASARLVSVQEMLAAVTSPEEIAVNVPKDIFVRMNYGIHKGDLAKVIDVDDQTDMVSLVTVKLRPRICLQDLWTSTVSNIERTRLDAKRRKSVPSPSLFDIEEAGKIGLPVELKENEETGEVFHVIGDMKFKDGFLYTKVPKRQIRFQDIQVTAAEMEKFEPGANIKDRFAVGVAVMVRDDPEKLVGVVKEVVGERIYLGTKLDGKVVTIPYDKKELRRFFKVGEVGDNVEVVCGDAKGTSGMVVKVEAEFLELFSVATRSNIVVPTEHVEPSHSGIAPRGHGEMT